MIDLKLIKIEGTQSRAALNNEVMNEYAEAMRCGAKFPPVKLFFDGSDYWLADGFHRYFASKAAEIDTINADIENGSKDDAILYSIGSNFTHGLRRTNADKRYAASMLLNHPIWSDWSDRAIASEAGVSHVFVFNLRKELNEKVLTVNTTPTPVLGVATEKAQKQENSAPKETVKPHLNLVENLDQEHQLSNEELAEIEQKNDEIEENIEDENENVTEEIYTETDRLKDDLSELRDLVAELQNKLSIGNYDGAEPIEDIINELKNTKLNLKQVTNSRDSLLNENNQLKKQILMQRKEIDKLKK